MSEINKQSVFCYPILETKQYNDKNNPNFIKGNSIVELKIKVACMARHGVMPVIKATTVIGTKKYYPYGDFRWLATQCTRLDIRPVVYIDRLSWFEESRFAGELNLLKRVAEVKDLDDLFKEHSRELSEEVAEYPKEYFVSA